MTPDLVVGRAFGRYAIEARVGTGGMGSVYRARDTVLGRLVALKVLRVEPDQTGDDPERVTRFHREARMLASMQTPGIVGVYDFGEMEGTPFLAMEWIEGRTLSSVMREPVTIEKRVELLTRLAESIAFAHRQGIVHRDVKPSNVVVARDGRPWLVDFGIAKRAMPVATRHAHPMTFATRGDMLLGTPAYMAPEQTETSAVDARADQFAWGVVAFELLAGTHPSRLVISETSPFPLGPAPALAPRAPGLSPGVAAVIDRTLAIEPKVRFGSMDEVVAALRSAPAASAHRTSAIPPASVSPGSMAPGSMAPGSKAPASFAPASTAPVSSVPVPTTPPPAMSSRPSLPSYGSRPSLPSYASHPSLPSYHPPGWMPGAVFPAPSSESKLPMVLAVVAVLIAFGGVVVVVGLVILSDIKEQKRKKDLGADASAASAASAAGVPAPAPSVSADEGTAKGPPKTTGAKPQQAPATNPLSTANSTLPPNEFCRCLTADAAKTPLCHLDRVRPKRCACMSAQSNLCPVKPARGKVCEGSTVASGKNGAPCRGFFNGDTPAEDGAIACNTCGNFRFFTPAELKDPEGMACTGMDPDGVTRQGRLMCFR